MQTYTPNLQVGQAAPANSISEVGPHDLSEKNKSSAIAEMAAQCCTRRIFTIECGGIYLSLTHSFSVTSENIVINHILPKKMDALDHISDFYRSAEICRYDSNRH